MKYILIIITILLSSLVDKAQGQDSTLKRPIAVDNGHSKRTITRRVMDTCYCWPVEDNMFLILPEINKNKVYSEPLYMPNSFEPYLSDDGSWIINIEAAKKDTIPYLKSKSVFSKADKEYIRILVTRAYYNGFNNATVLDNEIKKHNKMQKDLRKLNAAIDKSF